MKVFRSILIFTLVTVLTGLGVAETVETGQTNEVDVAGETYEITLETKTKDTATISINEAKSLPLEENEKFTANKVTVKINSVNDDNIDFTATEEKKVKTVYENQKIQFLNSGSRHNISTVEQDGTIKLKLDIEGDDEEKLLNTDDSYEFNLLDISPYSSGETFEEERNFVTFRTSTHGGEVISINESDGTPSYEERIEISEKDYLTEIYSYPGFRIKSITDYGIDMEPLNGEDFVPVTEDQWRAVNPFLIKVCDIEAQEDKADIYIKDGTDNEETDICPGSDEGSEVERPRPRITGPNALVKGGTVEMNIAVTDKLTGDGYRLTVEGPDGNQKTSKKFENPERDEEISLGGSSWDKGEYKAEVKTIEGSIIDRFVSLLSGTDTLAEKSFLVMESRWKIYCTNKGYNLPNIKGEINCIEEQMVPEFFSGGYTGSESTYIPNNLCKDLLGSGYSYNSDDGVCDK